MGADAMEARVFDPPKDGPAGDAGHPHDGRGDTGEAGGAAPADLQALGLWHKVVLGSVRDDTPDLTQRQLALILTVYLAPGPHSVRSLADHLGVQRPVVTRALDTLGAMGLVLRRRDETDRRRVLVLKTPKGQDFLTDFARMIHAAGGLQDTPCAPVHGPARNAGVLPRAAQILEEPNHAEP